ncbi:MAG TPA: glycosyltransferase family 4 protein [Gaiellaceae bacterium]|nr:glycosyltransferase family 4 protein [Gaiellaceae bacterium]
MRILILHSRYLSGSLSGENRVVEEEAQLLRGGGHHVELVCLSPDEHSAPALVTRSLLSLGSAAAIRDRVRSGGFEVVHCHNLYPTLGAGVLSAAAKAGAAVVLTLHSYRLVCIAATFFRDRAVCQDCLGRLPWPGVVHACYRGSRAQSLVLATSLALARARRAFDSVHRYLAVSAFVRAKHIEAGLPAERILIKPNVVGPQTRRAGPGLYFLVLSRLSAEKGIAELVRAWSEELGELRIAGDGPLRGEIERLAHGRGVRVLGPVAPEHIPALFSGARALFVPSRWFEGQPRVVLEAYAAGVPVVASRIGCLPDVIADGETGFTVAFGDDEGWRTAARAFADDHVAMRLGAAAYERWRTEYSPERGLELLEFAYREALAERDAQAERSCS